MVFRLDKSQKITRTGHYRRVYDTGGKKVGRFLLLFAVKSESTRVGITVSSKVGIAVERNRVKRRLREAIKLEMDALPPMDLVFVAKRSIKTAGFDAIRKEIKSLRAAVSR